VIGLTILVPVFLKSSSSLECPLPECRDFDSGWHHVVEWSFGQPWLAQAEERFQPGRVRILAEGTILCLESVFEDAWVSRESYPLNHRAFLECDVLEIFLQREGEDYYHELHVTPSNSLLQIRLKSDDIASNKSGALVWESLIDSKTQMTDSGWRVIARVRLDMLSLNPLGVWRVSFGRYDYRPNGHSPVISSTSLHTHCGFHRIDEWRALDVGSLQSS